MHSTPPLPSALAKSKAQRLDADEQPADAFRRALGEARTQLLVAARRLAGGSDAVAEDLVQDTLTRALESSHTFDPRRELGPWLRRILLHLHIDRVRQEARRNQHAEVEPDHLGRETEPRLDRADELAQLSDALDEPGRTLLWRFHHDGDSIGLLSRELGLPEGTIKSHLHRARRLLATRFTLGPGAVLERQVKPPVPTGGTP